MYEVVITFRAQVVNKFGEISQWVYEVPCKEYYNCDSLEECYRMAERIQKEFEIHQITIKPIRDTVRTKYKDARVEEL